MYLWPGGVRTRFFSTTFMIAGAHPGPGTEAFLGPEPPHVRADPGQQPCGTEMVNAGNGLHQPPFLLIRRHRRHDLVIEILELFF